MSALASTQAVVRVVHVLLKAQRGVGNHLEVVDCDLDRTIVAATACSLLLVKTGVDFSFYLIEFCKCGCRLKRIADLRICLPFQGCFLRL